MMQKKTSARSRILAWRKRHRYALQVAALLLGVLAPFAIYLSIVSGWSWLAWVSFILLAAAMLITAWAG